MYFDLFNVSNHLLHGEQLLSLDRCIGLSFRVDCLPSDQQAQVSARTLTLR
jgi:hypothetical protein